MSFFSGHNEPTEPYCHLDPHSPYHNPKQALHHISNDSLCMEIPLVPLYRSCCRQPRAPSWGADSLLSWVTQPNQWLSFCGAQRSTSLVRCCANPTAKSQSCRGHTCPCTGNTHQPHAVIHGDSTAESGTNDRRCPALSQSAPLRPVACFPLNVEGPAWVGHLLCFRQGILGKKRTLKT